jgi:glycosyltransferase involved in cell wall biosynthesis
MTKKRIAFAHNFNDSDWLGGKNYFASLFGAIEALQPKDMEFVFVTGKKTVTNLPKEFPWLEVIRTPFMDRMHPLWLLRQTTLRTNGTDPLLEFLLSRHRIDLLSHSGPLRKGSRIKSLPWLYDFQFMHLPQYWEPKHILWAKKRYAAACKKSDGLIVSSHDAARDLLQLEPFCSLPRHVLQFVSNPVDFEKIAPLEFLTQKYKLPNKYFYLPNQFWTNKNHRIVIDALAILKRQGKSLTVVCTGKPFDGRRPEYFDELMRHREELGLENEFRVLGIVLMAHACAVMNPSRFEGWSTTVEEAKTLQRRLLLSDIGVHREQSPKNASFFGVDDPQGLSKLLMECSVQAPLALPIKKINQEYSVRLEIFGQNFLRMIQSTLQ